MEANEWAGYVRKCATGAWPIPAAMMKDQDDWRCRSIVGRALYFKEYVEDAMTVLSTVLPVEPDLNDVPEAGLSEAEHKVLCLRDVADIVWKLVHSGEAAETYITQGLELGFQYKHNFRTDVRGDLFRRLLVLMKDTGREEEALILAEETIKTDAENLAERFGTCGTETDFPGQKQYISAAQNFLTENVQKKTAAEVAGNNDEFTDTAEDTENKKEHSEKEAQE